jgi:signal transduction histidine kinase/CheY-like chemotaxis protein
MSLLPEIGVVLLLTTFLYYLRSTSREVKQLAEALDSILVEGTASTIRRSSSSKLLFPLTEKLKALTYRLDVLENQKQPTLSLMELALPHSPTLSSDPHNSSIETFLTFIQGRFSCKSAIAIFLAEEGSPEIFTVNPRNRTVEDAVSTHYLDFLSGDNNTPFGLALVSNLTSFDRTLHTFGYNSFITRPLEVRGTGCNQRGILWLGYGSGNPPSQVEIKRSESLADALSYHTSSNALLANASDKANKAETSEKEKSEFLTFVSHDIKSPLHNVTAVLHLLELQQPTKEGEELIEAALINCSRLSELVEDIISFSQYQAGCLQPTAYTCEVSELVLEVAESYKVVARMKGLGLSFDAPENHTYTRADKNHIKRILSNLISNSIKYSDTGTIQISITNSGNKIKIDVRDNGKGMTTEQLEKVFIPFSRFDGSQEGSGLGLPLSKILAEQNGGTLTALSSPEKGSLFSLNLPEIKVPISLPFKNPSTDKQMLLSTPLPVLVVDDDREVVESLCRGLEVDGWLPQGAVSVEEALQKLASAYYPLIVTDLNMPQGGAHRILEELARLQTYSEVVILSGESKLWLNSLPYPAKHLEKPILASDLSRELHRLKLSVFNQS